MPDRGKKHNWEIVDGWKVQMNQGALAQCSRCKKVSCIEIKPGSNSVGWQGKPTYGCTG